MSIDREDLATQNTADLAPIDSAAPAEPDVSAKEVSSADYVVGYGRPPKHTQFKKGQSGNPRGRPKGSKNLRTDLEEELQEKIEIREGNRSQTTTKQRAFVKSLVNSSIKGTGRSAHLLVDTMTRFLPPIDDASDEVEGLSSDESEILRAFEARMERRALAKVQQKGEPEPTPLPNPTEEPS